MTLATCLQNVDRSVLLCLSKEKDPSLTTDLKSGQLVDQKKPFLFILAMT